MDKIAEILDTAIMSFDCRYKAKDYMSLKLNRECSPGCRGCVLYGKYEMPFREEKEADEKKPKKTKIIYQVKPCIDNNLNEAL